LINNKIYVGSAVNLTKRFITYYSQKHIIFTLKKSNSAICSALLKYGYENFSLYILEYCDSSVVIEREQYYMDLLNPLYNICRIAGSTSGRKHTAETKNKISLALKGRKPSIEQLIKMRNRRQSSETIAKIKAKLTGRKLSINTIEKIRLSSQRSFIKIINIENNIVEEYYSVRDVAQRFNVCIKTIYNYVNTNNYLKNKYLIIKK
jgi:group I intron endonuclease